VVIYEDTRQQKGRHKNIHAYCEKQGIEIIRQALNVGDYQIAGKGDVSVDTKQDVRELAMDIFQQHRRFREECERAQRCGIKLIVLIEEVLPSGGLRKWRSPIGRDGQPLCRFDPKILRKAMITMQQKYGVTFRFCDGRSTGKVMIEYLEGKRQ
jgi:ERCC4-type nuclease